MPGLRSNSDRFSDCLECDKAQCHFESNVHTERCSNLFVMVQTRSGYESAANFESHTQPMEHKAAKTLLSQALNLLETFRQTN